MRVFNTNNIAINYELALLYMDEEIKSELCKTITPCSEQKFFTAYEHKHRAKFGEDFIVSEVCAAW